jgi:hypothetical protein
LKISERCEVVVLDADVDDSVEHRAEVVNLKSQSFATVLELGDAPCLSIEKFSPVVGEIVSSHRRRWRRTEELPSNMRRKR